MYKYALVFILLLFSKNLFGQIDRELRQPEGGEMRKMDLRDRGLDSIADRGTRKVAKNEKAKIEDYKIISRRRDTVHVDTTLTIQKEFKFNYLRRDYFDLLPFNNMGQTYITLSKDMSSRNLLPGFGA